MPAATIRRVFGLKDDEIVGGSTYDSLAPAGEIPAPIPDATYFWPASGGTFDKGLEQIDRSAEVRGRRSISPRLPFRAAGVMTIPVPAYRSVLEKALRKVLGGIDVVTGAGEEARTHTLGVLGFAEGPLPAVHAQMVRDNYNLKMSGSAFNRLTANFTIDSEGTVENELHGLYFSQFETTPPTASFAGLSSDPLILRDGRVVLDGSGAKILAPAAPAGTPEAGGTLPAGAYKYVVTSVNATGSGESLPTAEFEATAAASGKIKLKWTAAAGAGSYNIYRVLAAGGATKTEKFLVNVAGTEYTDTGALTPAGKVPPTEDTSQGIQIPDLTGFEFSFVNNLMKKWYAKRNVVTNTIGNPPLTKKLWHPTEMKLNAAQDVSYRLNFGNVETAQEIAQEYGQIQKLIFEVVGSPLSGVTPAATELVRFTIYNAVHNPGGGAAALGARDDILTELSGTGFYSTADGKDIQVEVVNASATPLT